MATLVQNRNVIGPLNNEEFYGLIQNFKSKIWI